MSKPLSPIGVAVLALLQEQPRHPYELYATMIERKEDLIIKVKPGTLYHTIDRLADDGFIQVTDTTRSGNRPERTTYAITDNGLARFTDDITELLARPVAEYPRFPQAIAEAHNLPVEAVIEHLSTRHAAMHEWAEELAIFIDAVQARGLPESFWLEVAYMDTMHRAEMDWIAAVLSRLRSGDLVWPDTTNAATKETDPEGAAQ